MGDAVVGPDGKRRCPWGAGPEYLSYHDTEWGQPVREESALLERITLEAFQSGLSWLTILRKRPAFRVAFADFDPQTVAAFTDEDRDRLMADPGIVRNRRKIDAAIAGARATVALRDEGGLVELFWSFRPAQVGRPRKLADVPSSTPESVALAKTLRTKGFEHIGPTTMYAAMQACGLVTDHLVDCEFGGAV